MHMAKELSDINVQTQMKNCSTEGTQYLAFLEESQFDKHMV